MTLVAGEKGKVIRINTASDLVGASSVELFINPPGVLPSRTVSPSIGAVDILYKGTHYKANNYVEYVVDSFDGTQDFPVKGYYSFKLTVKFGTIKTLKSKVNRIYIES